jgi:predicted TIM-barrel fold metal-dependent hydrolase
MFRIDTHSHFTTPALYKLSTARGVNQAALADWTPAKMLQQMEEELRRFYYDTAQAFNPYTMPSFKKFVPVDHIVFGTDYPLGGGSAAAVAKGLRDNGGFTDAQRRAIERDNALGLLPRLKT